ncbi:MAG: sialate O-acetylesterase, partial [Oscillospiraceae bacterium]
MSFSAASVFSDNMVLQRGKNVRVFGTGEDGARITAAIMGCTASALVKDGKWTAVLPPLPETSSAELYITDGKDSIVFKNVAVGEVWLAGG